MKKSLLFIFTIGCCLGLWGQATNWQWAQSAIGSGEASGYAVCSDALGNAYITGSFSGPAITFGPYTLTNAGSTNVFVVKYDAGGNVVWAKSAGGSNVDVGYSVCTDATGNLFLTGHFQSSSITFGAFTFTNSDPSGNSSDGFLVKYDANGNVLWAKSIGGPNIDAVYSASADAAGNLFVSGTFKSPSVSLGTTTLVNADASGNSGDLFIAKYAGNGNLIWANRAGTVGDDDGYAVKTDPNGNVFMTGDFRSPAIFFGSTTLLNPGQGNMFIAKYDSNGNALWAAGGGGLAQDAGISVSTDASGNALVTGYFTNTTITFGSFTLAYNGTGYGNMFIAKFDPNGNVLWAKGASNNSEGHGAGTDAAGNTFVTGCFFSPGLILGNDTLAAPPGSVDPLFIAKYDANGNLLCASVLASGGYNLNGISTDPFGNAYVVSSFCVPYFSVGPTVLMQTGTSNIFLVKYDCKYMDAIAEPASEESSVLFPNPSQGIFNLDAKAVNGTISVYNAIGENVFTSGPGPQNSTLDLSSEADGIYFVTVKTAEKIFTQKITIAH